jgi:hypothetical protein
MAARLLAAALVAALAAAGGAGAAGLRDDRREARADGTCAGGARAELRLRAEEGAIEAELDVDRAGRGAWRVALVHERRVAWKGRVRPAGSSRSFEVERRLRDLPGADVVAARAWGPGGRSCRVSARLPA